MEKINSLIGFCEDLNCEVRKSQLLRDYTTFKIGGECPAVILPSDTDMLCEIIKKIKALDVKFTVIGNGSNLLCDDKGFNGVVIKIGKNMDSISLVNDTTISVSAGTSLKKLCNYALDNSLTGLEFAYGIPGTVGGAVFMNAGAYDGEIKQVIVSCETVDMNGNIKKYTKEEMDLSYRHSAFQSKDEIIVSAVFELKKGDKDLISEKMNDLMSRRKEKQPLDLPNAGSTFKRPVGQFAGKLIQDCGLRGFRMGGAMVSDKHCGFVVNKENATFDDVMSVISQVQDKVLKETGFLLECEVKILKY
ncbi:MAG: UDP-N-acetylmuramate dehydrogenase [Ruminococcus sp.]|nr:UDP-N-acetylmuramate dehydrogenase [Ruminococcus sp.]